jgi:integrase
VNRRRLPPGSRWVTLPTGARRVEIVLDVGVDPATGKRQQTRRRFTTEDEARDEWAKLRSQTKSGTYVGRSALTLAAVVEEWLAGKRTSIRATTHAGYKDVLKPVINAYGGLPVQRLTKRHVSELIVGLRSGTVSRSDGKPRRPWKPRTVNLLLFVLGDVLDDAMKQGLISRNVAGLIDRLPQTRHEMQTFTPAEVRKVLAVARTDRLEPAWHLALYGLRRGEVCGLTWTDIDLKSRTLSVRESRVSIDGEAVVSGPKTDRGRRTLPLSDALAKTLRGAKRRRAAEQLAAGSLWHGSEYLITDEIGEPLHPDSLTDRWETLVKSAGVRRIRLHDARHTAGTLMHLEGVPIAVISAWLGHADAAFTMRTYVHSQNDALLDASRRLPGGL